MQRSLGDFFMEKKIRDFIIGKDTNVYVKDEWIKKQLNSLKKDTSILDAGAGQCQWKIYSTGF